MKYLAFCFLFVSGFLFSQASRFVYSVQMKTDTTTGSEIQIENAFLDIDGKKSVFIAEKAVQRDSLMKRSRQMQQRPDRSTLDGLVSSINYVIEKDFSSEDVQFQSRIGRDNYVYTEKMQLPWTITSETSKIDEYTAQKAVVEYGGRVWEAWFTMDIPFSDGPYKFKGLPGLIIRVEDKTGDYKFNLIETKKVNDVFKNTVFGNVIKVKKSDFVKTESRFRKDPAEFMMSSAMASRGSNSNRGRGGMAGTRSIGVPQESRTRMLLAAQSNNNPIELE